MNKKVKINILKYTIDNSKALIMIMLSYIGLGFFASIISLSITNYINLFDLIFNNLNFISIFILPAFLAVGTKSFILTEKNYFFFSRFYSKKEYFNFQIKNIINITNILFFSMILLILIFINFKGSFKNVIEQNIFYSVPNIIICIFGIIKVYLLIIIFQILNILLLKSLLSKKLVYIIEFLLIFFLYNSYLVPNIKSLKFILPSTYFDFTYMFSSFLSYFIFSLFYLSSIILILYFCLKSIVIKKNIEIGE